MNEDLLTKEEHESICKLRTLEITSAIKGLTLEFNKLAKNMDKLYEGFFIDVENRTSVQTSIIVHQKILDEHKKDIDNITSILKWLNRIVIGTIITVVFNIGFQLFINNLAQ